ncbi:uncharacterized protein BDV17DRAFT_21441 [Aspergillus undulatus]|uniref:uncharacterized protein n=1 Tax=Aspergillus undulatus TaxID=1810928 RepID=UPI003CCCE50F
MYERPSEGAVSMGLLLPRRWLLGLILSRLPCLQARKVSVVPSSWCLVLSLSRNCSPPTSWEHSNHLLVLRSTIAVVRQLQKLRYRTENLPTNQASAEQTWAWLEDWASSIRCS